MRRYYYMFNKNGLDLICDICGRTDYIKRVKGHEVVNGRLTKEVYSNPQPGWFVKHGMDICPDCNTKN